jgi:hypothetical protein
VMQDLAPAQFHDHEYIKDAEASCEHHEKVTSRWPAKYFRTVRGETRIPSFNFNSLAMCSSPQVGFSAAIFRINSWRSLGTAGRPTGLDFHRQNKRNPRRCHRISVSGFTTTRALRQSNIGLKRAISHLAESSARWGLTLRPKTSPVAFAGTGSQRPGQCGTWWPTGVVRPSRTARWLIVRAQWLSALSQIDKGDMTL